MKRYYMRLALISMVLLVFSSVIAGCCCPMFNQYQELKKLVPVGTVKGTVFAGEPKQAVEGATVVIADQSTTTDAQGNFKLSDVVATNQTIVVTKDTLSWTGTADVTKDAEVTLPEIILSETK